MRHVKVSTLPHSFKVPLSQPIMLLPWGLLHAWLCANHPAFRGGCLLSSMVCISSGCEDEAKLPLHPQPAEEAQMKGSILEAQMKSAPPPITGKKKA